MKSRTTLPKGVWFQKKTLATGEVVRYGYFGRGPGMEPLGREGGPDFHFNLAEVLRRAPDDGKVAHLIWRYKSSPEFKKLRPLTQRDYNRQLDKIHARFAKLSIAAIQSPKISDVLYDWRDKMAETSPRQADYAISVLGAMLTWCGKRGLVAHNRAAGIEDVYKAERSEKVWTPEMVKAVLAASSPAIQRAIILALETGLSQEDLLILTWSAIQNNVIVARRLKTGVPVAIPISPTLAAMLAEAPKVTTTILSTPRKRPFNPNGNGLRSDFQLMTAKSGVEGRTFNDMRGTFITNRRAMGWTAEETALCSGHPIPNEKGAQGAYVDRQAVAIQNAIRLWARFYRPKRGTRIANCAANQGPEGEG